jgi:hypothetical protein
MACKHFSIAELVAPEILAQLTEPAAWRLIPEKIQSNLDGLREAPPVAQFECAVQCGSKSITLFILWDTACSELIYKASWIQPEQ